jgi:hypothetical protein
MPQLILLCATFAISRAPCTGAAAIPEIYPVIPWVSQSETDSIAEARAVEKGFASAKSALAACF